MTDEAPKFVDVPLQEFHEGKALWAANFFVLWPLGLALTVHVDRDKEPAEYVALTVRQHEWTDGHRETIEQPPEVDDADMQAFIAWARERIKLMPREEANAAVAHFYDLGLAL